MKNINKNLTKSDIIKLNILKALSDFKDHTPSEISSLLNTNGKTIITNCNFLEMIGIIEIEKKETKKINYYLRLRNTFKFNSIKDFLKILD